MNNHLFLGKTMPDLVSDSLKTGFFRFESKFNIHGLAKEQEGMLMERGMSLVLLAFYSTEKRKGNFRTFIEKAKSHYPQIIVLEVWNSVVAKALVRYGFEFRRIWYGGQEVDSFVWHGD